LRAIVHGLRSENNSLRGLSGQGEPGLWTLLGGTGAEEDASAYQLTGGAGQVSSTSRVARAYRDVRVANVSAGLPPNTGGGAGPPINPGPPRPEPPK
jgi:hypothetical protein